VRALFNVTTAFEFVFYLMFYFYVRHQAVQKSVSVVSSVRSDDEVFLRRRSSVEREEANASKEP